MPLGHRGAQFENRWSIHFAFNAQIIHIKHFLTRDDEPIVHNEIGSNRIMISIRRYT